MITDVVVIGAGGFGRETLDVIEAINQAGPVRYNVLGVADDRPSELNAARLTTRGYPILGTIDEVVQSRPTRSYALAIGSPAGRQAVADRLEAAGWQPQTLIHPAAVLGSVAGIGDGSIICGGVQLSTNTRLGRYVHLNPNATIGHDTDLGDFVSVNPGAIVSGEVRIGERVLVGAGAVILQGLAIGERSVVGASACVTREVPPAVVVKGVPGRWT